MTEESPDYTLAIESAGPSTRGGFEFRMRPGIDLAKHLTQSVRSVLDGHGADNYVEMRFDDGEGNEYIATFRRRSGKTPDEMRQQAEAERDTAREVARGNKRHVAVLTEMLDRVEKYADRLANYCSPHGVTARYAAELRAELSRPTEAERAGATRPARTASGEEQPVREPDGCPEPVWDGPYQMRCGLGASVGVCHKHGRFRDNQAKGSTR